MAESNLQIALKYLSIYGWSVIPILKGTKKPVIVWKEFQTRKPTKDEVTKWWSKYPDAGIAVVTGKISNIFVIDIDPRHGGTLENFKDIKSALVKTGGNGWHIYLKFSNSIHNATSILPGIDIRGEGGYIIAPPSVHESGNLYKWLNDPEEITIIDAPKNIIDLIVGNKKNGEENNINDKQEKESFDAKLLEGVSVGSRNNTAASVIGKLFNSLPTNEWDTTAWGFLNLWNKNNKPPLPESELKSVFESIKKRKPNTTGNKKTSLVELLVADILSSKAVLFHDKYKTPFISTSGYGKDVYPINSEDFRMWVSKSSWERYKRAPTASSLDTAIKILSGIACFEKEMIELDVRIRKTKDPDCIWYDLGNGKVVKIDRYSYQIVDAPPILFTSFNHQVEQSMPMPGGKILEIFNFINIESESEKLLILVWLVASYIPGFSHPPLVLHGSKGAAKTTTLIVLKRLIDPSVLKLVSPPKNLEDFVLLCMQHYFFFLDNLSDMKRWLSDSLARACTGDGFSTRQLFTNTSTIIFSFQRTIGLNGIPLVVKESDLLDRSILLKLERIPENKKIREEEASAQLEKRVPYILGDIFDIVSKALAIYPSIKLNKHPRMANFAAWGCAIAKALGYTEKLFLDAYYENIRHQNEAAIDASPLASTIQDFMQSRDYWEDTASKLLTILEEHSKLLKIDVLKIDYWPKSPSSLSRRLPEIESNLADIGISISKNDSIRPKTIIIRKVYENTDNVDKALQTSIDDMSAVSTFSKDTQISFKKQSIVPSKPCTVCNSKKFWVQGEKNVLCALCHPPISDSYVKRWINL